MAQNISFLSPVNQPCFRHKTHNSRHISMSCLSSDTCSCGHNFSVSDARLMGDAANQRYYNQDRSSAQSPQKTTSSLDHLSDAYSRYLDSLECKNKMAFSLYLVPQMVPSSSLDTDWSPPELSTQHPCSVGPCQTCLEQCLDPIIIPSTCLHPNITGSRSHTRNI